MSILAIDTTTQWCSVAIFMGPNHYFYRHENVGNLASQTIFSLLQDVLDQTNTRIQEIDHFAVAIGPGAFTGIRLGVGVAQGIAFAQAKPLIPITSLDGMVAYHWLTSPKAFDSEQLMVAMDARMNQVYCAEYCVDGDCIPKRTGNIFLHENRQFQHNYQNLLSFETNQYKDFHASFTKSLPSSPHALGIALQANLVKDLEGFAPQDCQPLYIRDKVAQTTLERSTQTKS